MRWQHLREDWRSLAVLLVAIPAFAAVSLLTDGFVSRLYAALFGATLVLAVMVWIMGGHASNLRWWWGVQGERDTAKEIEKLGPEWHCEHDVELPYGNWDHLLVGPPGVFLLDSKALNGASVASEDALRAGRLRFDGSSFRSAALRLHDELARTAPRPVWVQAVVVVWGEFAQRKHEEQRVVYIRGDELVEWLGSLSAQLNGPMRASIEQALREIRAAMIP